MSPLAHIGAVPATVSGARFDPSTLTGKPVVLWFWAPWCTVCRSEAPAVTKVAADFAGRVDIIGVAGQGTKGAMADFVKQTGTSGLTHLADVNGTVWRAYGVSVQPSFAFITPDGRADLRVGSLDEKTLHARVAEVATGSATSTVSLPPGQTCSRAPDGTLLCGSAGPGQPTTTIPDPTASSAR
ncbi:redoxin domain-containing protein [Pedococcus sp. NPDC057267]|uniref:redoxin domain-containing protein n=1 Tax=Pedococcus sp. NPDC057267 TaxID=3346077 RepID=UPI003638684B